MANAGGFILSPPPSSVRSASTATAFTLPHQRAHPLKAGSSKESTFIRHVDQQLLHIQRRFAKRTSPSIPQPDGTGNGAREGQNVTSADIAVAGSLTEIGSADYSRSWAEDTKGYSSMKQACKDIAELVDIIWVSGTPSLQIPYLINVALLLSTVIPSMPPSPKELFRCLGKMDRCFASLIQGRDVESGEVLSGFDGFEVGVRRAKGLSGTEKVRIRSLVERTRVGVVEAFKRGEFELYAGDDESEGAGGGDVHGLEHDGDVDMEGELVLEGEDLDTEGEDDEDDSWDMQLARVYDRTIQELGDTLEGEGIGIVTEPRG